MINLLALILGNCGLTASGSDDVNVLLNDLIMKQVHLFISNHGICDLIYGETDFYDSRKTLCIHVVACEFDD